MPVLSTYEALDYIESLKRKLPNDSVYSKFLEWCDDHEPLYKLHRDYVLYPLLRDKDTKEVACYMNQHGYHVNTYGISTHPIEDYLGISHLSSTKLPKKLTMSIEMQEISSSMK